ncbi:MAG: tRNA-dihydrouridine synthase family protein [candidate division KSB1 bacterium]|mgnify:CR=1 FL=1
MTHFSSVLQLGTLSLKSRFLLAPLESVSDAAFRRLAWELGAGLTFTEMIRAQGVARKNRSTIDLIDTIDREVPTGIQLMTTGSDELKSALSHIEDFAYSTHSHLQNICAIDLNFGCPSPQIIRAGGGPALLKRRSKLREIFTTLNEFKASTRLPIRAIGAKIRLGLNRAEQDQKIYLAVADIANESLDYLTVHARHGRSSSEDRAVWSAIAEVKARSSIPVIGNGDILQATDAKSMYQQSNCDGFLIARGAIRSPWIFRGLTAQGIDAPESIQEIDALEERYVALSHQYTTKSKFRSWHAEGFQRMRDRFLGINRPSEPLPTNENL